MTPVETPGNDQTRRKFLALGSAAAVGGALPSTAHAAQQVAADAGEEKDVIDAETIAHAEKLMGVTYTDAERQTVAVSIVEERDRALRRREFPLANGDAPAQVLKPGGVPRDATTTIVRSPDPGAPKPGSDVDIAFAPVYRLSRWIERGEITSLDLTKIYLDRLKRLGPKLECTITLTEDLALAQARAADELRRAGDYLGPLHGIPWGAKDLLDTKGLPTTWGATPYRNRVAEGDATVVTRLARAGAVLIGKLTLGALAYGDQWFGGRTRSPWNLERGSSGSSAGSAAATAAGLVGFSLGTETLGSIVSPSMRCGTVGLRPTFGRVARTGAMALCWSLDKIGPITRTIEDAVLVLDAIDGADPGDPSSVDGPLSFDATAPVAGRRLGYDPRWFEGRGGLPGDLAALEAARAAGFELVEVTLPDWPYDALLTILSVEAAAAFEELTLSDRDDELVWQAPQAWPNSFRTTRFISAIEYVQAERFRRRVMAMMAERMAGIDALISPSFAGSLLLITNNTGHPSITLRTGFRRNGMPHGVTLWGQLFGDGALAEIAHALEAELGVWDQRPAMAT